MEEEQIAREFTRPHKSGWLASLEWTVEAGEDQVCYQFVDNLKDEPKIRERFFRAMYQRTLPRHEYEELIGWRKQK
jgi:hypothetical protein